MIRMFAAEGAIDFTRYESESAHPKPETHIPGSVMYDANQPSGQFHYQTYSKKNYTLYYSTYAPVLDVTLRVEFPLPFLGFRIMVKSHIEHHLNGLAFHLLQGQVNVVYAPTVDSELLLKEKEVYEVFDLQIEEGLLERLRVTDHEQATLLEALRGSQTVALFGGPGFASAYVLDAMTTLLKDPGNEELALQLLQQVIEVRRMKRPQRQLTRQQVEGLFRVKNIIKDQLKKDHRLGDLARQAYMNLTYFKEMFKIVFGVTPYHYLLYERIKAAKKLMQRYPDLTLSQVAVACGFNNDNNLRRAFKSVEKMTLAHWQKLSDVVLILISLESFF
ncbi:MAG: helix-turn-helix domain-containing protein [Pseudobacter sp.]|uniref:AraC family transcriptional regulator n=1 Tax=Pseudobacter sp. TaxID=2045420 RepID=UPI003F7DA18A